MRDLIFSWAPQAAAVVDIPRFDIHKGEHVFLTGPSGSGKSTLLSVLAAILPTRHGSVRICGTALEALGAAARDRFRADHIGLIFQLFNLLPYLSVVENVCLPCRFSRTRAARASRRSGAPLAEARRLLARLGLDTEQVLHQRVATLSVGQQQRVAVARALIGAPALIIADEPTSALDQSRRTGFIDLLFEQLSDSDSTLLFVSHEHSLGTRFPRCLDLQALNRVPIMTDML